MKNLLAIISVFCCCMLTFGQSNFTQYQLNNTAQSQYLNPAFRSSSKIGVSVAPFSNFLNLQLLNTGFSLDDALATRPDSDTLDLTPDKLLSNLNDVNYLDLNFKAEILGLVITTKKSSISLTINSVVNSGFSYPKDLLRLAFYGNGSEEFLGKRASIDNLGVDALAYLETGIGFNRKFNDKLVIGGKIKYLIGVGNLQTQNLQAGIYTDSITYALEGDFAGQVNTTNYEGLQSTVSGISGSFNPFSMFRNLAGVKNNGIGFDIGATYKLGKKIRLSASVIDIGSITWRDGVTNYQVDEVKYEFKGIDLFQYLEDSNAIIDDIADSLETLANYKESNNEYSTRLYTKAYLGGNFNITKFFNVGMVWFSSFNPSRYITGLNLSANVKLRHWLAASANYSVYNYRDSNVGLGLSARSGPFQIYVMSDNVIALIKPEATKNLHFNFGMSIQVGKSHEYDKRNEEMSIF
ncbi:MAG: DUF5723 family protein [Crocinitomicaceae bacterium]